MNNSVRKAFIISIISIFTVSILSGCTSKENTIKNYNIDYQVNTPKNLENVNLDLNYKDANVLEVDKPVIINDAENNKLIDTKTKVKNISKFNIRDIELIFREYDKDSNALAKTEALTKVTLKPEQSVYIQSSNKKFTKTVEVIGYSYKLGNKLIYVNLLDKDFKALNTNEKIVAYKKYDVLGISEPKITNEVKGGYNAQITIKNISDKDIGSVVLEVAELNDKNEYINVTHIDSYEVIKKSQEIKLNSVHSNDVKKLEVIGYVYDDVNDNTTVEVNLKLNEAILMK
jgi:hypothetical protein